VCGIAGYTHRARQVQPDLMISALRSIVHRGPDQQNFFVSPQISLGAVRLRIMDLQAGDQPLFSENHDTVVVFNGEIFNHRELRRELCNEGAKFHTNCDTEVVLQAFLRWGEGCLSRFRGMFAIAIWVQSQQRLILARDRMGIKPLYYCLQLGEIYFGSELKCLFVHPAIRRRISLSALNCFLTLNYVPGPFTLVDGIVKLMPGHWLEWRDGRSTLRSYLPARVNRTPTSRADEACEQLDHLLQEAVSEQLVADVPVGIWLSGGLDSSTVLYYTARTQASRLQTYSITFRGHSFDESDYARRVSSHFGALHSEFNLDPDADLIDAIERIAYYSDEPSADAGAVPLWFLARMTRKDVTVVLTGEGADELFAGYLTYRANRYHSVLGKAPALLRKAALSCAEHLPASKERISFEYKLKRLLRGSLLSAEMAHVFWNGTFSETEKRRMFLYDDAAPMAGLLGQIGPAPELQRFLDFDQRYYLPDDILYKVDRISMAHSLEVRPPFLDPRIVEFAASLDQRLKLRGSVSKYILRRLMWNKLPSVVLRRRKVGFDIPVHEWFRGALKPFLLDTVSREAVVSSGLFRWSAVEHLLRQHFDRKANLGYHLWGLMTLLVWMRRWRVELGKPEGTTALVPFRAFGEVGSLPQPLA
jgi:asparagine synthase (glutamine-hydrolysing)